MLVILGLCLINDHGTFLAITKWELLRAVINVYLLNKMHREHTHIMNAYGSHVFLVSALIA